MKAANESVELLRWRAEVGEAETSSSPEARAAGFASAAREGEALSPETMSRIQRAVVRRRQGPGMRWGRGLGLQWQLAILVLMSLASVATAKGMISLWRKYVAAPVASVTGERESGRAHAKRSARAGEAPAGRAAAESAMPGVAGGDVAVGGPSVDAPPAADVDGVPSFSHVVPPSRGVSSSSRAHRRHGGRQAAARVAAPALAPTSPASEATATATEAQLLGQALGRLRQQHDAVGALALLDTYARSFPRGVLASEAQAARIEATLQAGDRKAALALLDRRDSFAGRVGAQWQLTRAELRAAAGRYPEALDDFDYVVGRGDAVPAAEAERALYGRAVCLGRVGRDDKARADLAAYRARFPQGKHAAEVSRLLGGEGAKPAP